MKTSYSAVVLNTEFYRELLLSYLDNNEFEIPEGWEVIAHHMTIKMGELPDDMKNLIGEKYSLDVVAIGKSDKAMAVKVEDNGLSTNKIPHITIAVNRKAGGKPYDSNFIENWVDLDEPFTIVGIIREL